MLASIADLLRLKRPDLIVEIAHMELAEPTIAKGIQACIQAGATEVIVHPYMLSPGRHATRDIPQMAQEAAKRYPHITITTTAPLGIHEKLAEVVLERSAL